MTAVPPAFSVRTTLEILRRRAGCAYEGEGVDELEHARQTAQHARDAGAGERFCREHLSERAAALVGLHVPAKRYLVATDATYAAALSPASVRSLTRQGGPMSPEEVHRFERDPHGREAARLRRWDDAAKVRSARTDALETYERDLSSVWARGPAPDGHRVARGYSRW